MTEREQKLIDYAEYVLNTLERDEDWNANTLDDIGMCAVNLELGRLSKHGYFLKNV